MLLLGWFAACHSCQVPWNKGETDLHNKDDTEQRVLHTFEADMSMSSNGFSHITRKLKALVPLLMNSFLEFFQLVHAKANLEGKSFACMASILTDLIVRSFVYGTGKKPDAQVLKVDLMWFVWDVTVSSALMDKLFPLFPLNPVHRLSDKDYDRLLDLNVVIAKIFFELNEWICLPPVLPFLNA